MGPRRRSAACSTCRLRDRAGARRFWPARITSGCGTRSWTFSRNRSMPEMADPWLKTMCPYCGVGCGLLARVEAGRVVKVKGDPEHPANFGDVCAKAVHLPQVLGT